MDPDADGRLSLDEVKQGLARAHQDADARAREARAGEVMSRLEAAMAEAGTKMRVRDLFAKLDEDGSGEITLAELRQGLARLAGPSAAERFRAKKAAEKADKARRAKMTVVALEAELRARLDRAEASGALAVLQKLDLLIKRRNLTALQLFKLFDEDGSGDLDVDEFMDGLARHFKSELCFSRNESRLLVDFFDENGDGSIEPQEFSDVIARLRKDQKKAALLFGKKKQ